MTSFSIHKFKANLNKSGGFARSHLFSCNISRPTTLVNDFNMRDVQLFCKSAKVPAFEVHNTKLHYMTKEVNIPGGRRNTPFSATFYNTNNYNIYGFFATWNKLINIPENNIKTKTNPDQTLYTDLELMHYSPEANINSASEAITFNDNIPIAKYTLQNAWPSVVSGFTLAYDQDEEMQVFTVDFQYLTMDYEVIDKSSLIKLLPTNNIKYPVFSNQTIIREPAKS